MPALNVSGVLSYSKKALKLARDLNEEEMLREFAYGC
jgi:hypothetical protein